MQGKESSSEILLTKVIEFGLAIALGGTGLFGLFSWIKEYRRAQHWKEAEFAFELYDEFETDESIQKAKERIDYVYKDEKALDEILRVHTHYEDEKKKFKCNVCQGSDINFGKSIYRTEKPEKPTESDIRGYFDQYLDFLGKVEYCLVKRLITEDELFHYLYWLDKTNEPQNQAVLHYAEGYEFKYFQNLMKRAKENGLLKPKPSPEPRPSQEVDLKNE